jgi:predicted HAD superfamily hydrolase
MKLVSFDIFDTTLIRKCGCADNVQWILAKKLFPNDEARQMEFYAWRRKSVKEQVNINYSLFDIYNTCGIEAFSPYTRQSLMNAERSVESDMLVGNPSIINIIRDYREKGWKVVFISDMYLDGKLLKEVLIREGAMEPSDTVFVSNEYAARKDGGGIYMTLFV